MSKKNIFEKIALVRRVQVCLTGSGIVGFVQAADGWHLRSFPDQETSPRIVFDDEQAPFIDVKCELDEDPEPLIDEALKGHYKLVVARASELVRDGISTQERLLVEKLVRDLEAEVVG